MVALASGLPLLLTGATAATRYVGGTASGAPGSGTFAVGDFVVDQTGTIWICTAAGTPGTWVKGASGAYASASVTHANSATTAQTGTLVMAGFGDTWLFTPTDTGKTLITVTGGFNTASGSAVGGSVGARYGIGSAPSAAAADIGTRFGGASDPLIRSGVVGTTQTPFTFAAVLALVKGTAYWFDLAFNTTNAGDPSVLLVPNFVAAELP